ncbi:sensor histidine kinase [Spirosoma pomorum]
MAKLNPSLLRSTNRRIAFGFLVASVLIALGFLMSLLTYDRYNEESKRVQRTQELIGQLQDVLSSLKDTETGVRGFIGSGDRAFLEPYNAALPLIPSQLARLHYLAEESSRQSSRIDTLNKLIEIKLANLARLVSEAERMTPELRAIYLRVDKRYMDQIRVWSARAIAAEKVLLNTHMEQTDYYFRSAIAVIFVLSLLTFLALGMSYRLLTNELERRQRNEDQLRAYELQLRDQLRQLESSNEELERFAFVASHDLQEPLRKIQSFANLITDRYTNLFDADSMMFMGKITKSAERMSKLIKDLLNFSRISSHQEEFRPVNLNQIIQRILDDQELRIKGLNVQVELGKLPTIPAVSSQIDHLFTNLISNALKFHRADVTPTLRIQANEVRAGEYPELMTNRRYVCISVEDNGIGFEEKYIEHIFKLFQRLHGKTTFEGTGIGLAICKRVVLYHHGHITAHSQPNQGTTFMVILPESQLPDDYDRSTSTEIYSHTISG